MHATPSRLAALAALPCALALSACGRQEPPAAAPVPAATPLAAVDTPPPQYPIEQACAGTGGTVTLRVTIGPEGKATDVRLDKSSGAAPLDAAAEKAVRETWTFQPATRAGQPVSQTIQVPVTFRPPQVRPDPCFALDSANRPTPAQ